MQWLKAKFSSPGVEVDRENNVIRGYVLAQEGPFKSAGRGEFDQKSLKQIVALSNKKPGGLKSRFTHPNLSEDGLGKYLGRAKNLRMDHVSQKRDGKDVLLHAVRGDLHLDPTSFDTPNGNLGKYVMDLAESDSDALSSSLVLKADQELRMDPKTKRPMLAEDGSELPPIWRPTELHASDVVDTGDAVDGFLSAHPIDGTNLPDGIVRQASMLLDQAFLNQNRDELRDILEGFVDRYLTNRFGEIVPEPQPLKSEPRLSIAEARRRLWLLENA